MVRLTRDCGLEGLGAGGSLGPGVRRGALAVRGLAVKVVHLVGDDLGRVALDPVLVVPRAGLEPTDDADAAALLEVFGRVLGGGAPDDDAVPLGVLVLETGGILPARVGRDRELGDGVAAGGVTAFGIGAEVADDLAAIQVEHDGISFCFATPSVGAPNRRGPSPQDPGRAFLGRGPNTRKGD